MVGTSAGFGGFLLYWWIGRLSRATATARSTHSRPPPYIPRLLVFLHVLLAIAGLGAWVGALYLFDPLAYAALPALGLVAVLGASMFVRWLGSRRARRAAHSVHRAPPVSRLPTVVVLGHGAGVHPADDRAVPGRRGSGHGGPAAPARGDGGRGPDRGGDVPDLVPVGGGQARRALPALAGRRGRGAPRPVRVRDAQLRAAVRRRAAPVDGRAAHRPLAGIADPRGDHLQHDHRGRPGRDRVPRLPRVAGGQPAPARPAGGDHAGRPRREPPHPVRGVPAQPADRHDPRRVGRDERADERAARPGDGRRIRVL